MVDRSKKKNTLKLQLVLRKNEKITAYNRVGTCGFWRSVPVSCAGGELYSVYLWNQGPVADLALGINTAEWSQESVKPVVFIYQQLWYFSQEVQKICFIFRPVSPPNLPSTPLSVSSGFWLSDGIFILNNWSWPLWTLHRSSLSNRNQKIVTNHSHFPFSHWTLNTRWSAGRGSVTVLVVKEGRGQDMRGYAPKRNKCKGSVDSNENNTGWQWPRNCKKISQLKMWWHQKFYPVSEVSNLVQGTRSLLTCGPTAALSHNGKGSSWDRDYHSYLLILHRKFAIPCPKVTFNHVGIFTRNVWLKNY